MAPPLTVSDKHRQQNDEQRAGVAGGTLVVVLGLLQIVEAYEFRPWSPFVSRRRLMDVSFTFVVFFLSAFFFAIVAGLWHPFVMAVPPETMDCRVGARPSVLRFPEIGNFLFWEIIN